MLRSGAVGEGERLNSEGGSRRSLRALAKEN